VRCLDGAGSTTRYLDGCGGLGNNVVSSLRTRKRRSSHVQLVLRAEQCQTVKSQSHFSTPAVWSYLHCVPSPLSPARCFVAASRRRQTTMVLLLTHTPQLSNAVVVHVQEMPNRRKSPCVRRSVRAPGRVDSTITIGATTSAHR
jgi:hypothetical protein